MEDNNIAAVEKNEVVESRIPLVDIVEDDDGVTLYFEVPGANSETVDIQVDNHVLSIVADSSLKYNGRPVQFKRDFRLSEFADVGSIKAKTRDGVLTLSIPKSERAKVHKIKVD